MSDYAERRERELRTERKDFRRMLAMLMLWFFGLPALVYYGGGWLWHG